MAWLGNREDADVPLLTRVYQVEDAADDTAEVLCGSEINRLVRWWRGLPQNGGVWEELLTPGHDYPQGIDALRKVRDARRLAVRMMDLAADEGQFDHEDRRELLGRIRGEQKKRGILFDPAPHIEAAARGTSEYGAGIGGSIFGTRHPLKDYAAEIPIYNDHDRGLALQLLSDLHEALLHSPDQLRRCEEDRSVFLARRPGQVFCSHRCANRAGMRRRRTKKTASSRGVSLTT